jgi:phosphoglycolate phosphatase
VSRFELAALDMAGTTVADEGLVEEAFEAAITEVGAPSPPPGAADHPATDTVAYVRRTMGRSKIEVFTALYEDATRARAANLAFEAAYRRNVVAGGVAPIDGAVEAIEAMRSAGIRVCLTTGFSAATRDALLECLGWEQQVDLVLSPGDAGRGRPWPDMILTAVIRLRVGDVRNVAVAGDTMSDLWAGHRAGAGIVAGVLSGAHGAAELASVPHTHILDSVRELPALIL